jgi:hypothetical protein
MLTSEPCAPGIRGCAHDWRRGFSAILSMALALSLLTAPLAADAQLSAQVPRIGFLFPGPASLASLRLEPFRQALRELGYIEGQNIAIETRWAEGKLDRLPELAAELVRLKVNFTALQGQMNQLLDQFFRGGTGEEAPGASARGCRRWTSMRRPTSLSCRPTCPD